MKIQRSPLFCAKHTVVKKDPGRARQNSLATAGTNFTKPGAQNKEISVVRMKHDFQIGFIVIITQRDATASMVHLSSQIAFQEKRKSDAGGGAPKGVCVKRIGEVSSM